MSGQGLKVNIVTVVWGEWHNNAFFRLNLPTLFAPDNLPSLIAQCVVTYDIYTRASDIETIIESESYRRLQQMMPVRLYMIAPHLVADDPVSDPITAASETWHKAVQQAALEGASVLLMPPDVVWSDGSLRHVGELLAQGRKVILNFYLRVVADTFIEEFVEHYRVLDGAIAVPSRELVDFSMHHIHPMMASYDRFWEYFPDHAEMIIWFVRGEGLLVRTLARECLLFDPRAYPLNAKNLIGVEPLPGELEFIADSDDLFAISLTPLGKDLDRWLSVPKKIDQAWLGFWWYAFDSPGNDATAAAKVRIHHTEPSESLWRQVEFGSDLLICRAAMGREALRTRQTLHELGCHHAAELLALAIETRAILRLTSDSGRFIVLAPSDKEIDLRPEQLNALLAEPHGTGINRLIRAHVVMLGENEPDLDMQLEAGRQVELTALDGSSIRLRREQAPGNPHGTIVVNDLYETSGKLNSGRNLVLRLEGALVPAIREAQQIAHEVNSMNYLMPQEYDPAEALALESVPNRIIECSQPAAFTMSGYPTAVSTVLSVGRYVDVMQERRAERYIRYLGGITDHEMALLGSVADKVATMTGTVYRRRRVPRCSLLQALGAARHIRYLVPNPSALILEVGPGSGYLGALLLEMGYRYISTDIAQAFYLYQNHLFNAVTGGNVLELASDPRSFYDLREFPDNCAVHVPWWKFVVPEPAIDLTVNLVTCNHALCEMHMAARTYLVRVAERMLRGPGLRPFVFEGWGSTFNAPYWHAGRDFSVGGFVIAHNDAQASVLVRKESDAAAVSRSLPLPGIEDEPRAFDPPPFADPTSPVTQTILDRREHTKQRANRTLADFDDMLRSIVGRQDLLTDDERFMTWSRDPRD